MADPLTILGLSYAGKEAIAVVGEFALEIFGPSARAVGKGIAAPLEAWAERRVEATKSVIVDAALQVQAAGGNPHPVPGRVLMPLLEKASLEEDHELRRRWVATGQRCDRAGGRSTGFRRNFGGTIAKGSTPTRTHLSTLAGVGGTPEAPPNQFADEHRDQSRAWR